MAMFGGLFQKRGIGGQQPQAPAQPFDEQSVGTGLSAIAGSLGGAGSTFATTQPQQDVPLMPKLSLMDKLGMAGDVLSGNNVFTPAIQAQRANTLAFAKQNNMQAQEFQRQLALAQWKAAHPEATELQRQHDYLMTIDPTGKLASDFITSKTTAPPVVQHNDDGTLSVYPAGMIPRTAATPQPAPAGVTFTPLPSAGGAGATAPRTFPGVAGSAR
jgi:hypothetical protein